MTFPGGLVTNWNTTTINGKQYLVIETAAFRIPLDFDPSSAMFIAVAAPDGALGNVPWLLKGDPGDPAILTTAIQFTPLDPSDPTPDAASLLALGNNTYQLVLSLHKGQKGDPGSNLLTPTDYGTPVYKNILQVNAATTGFEYATQKVGDRYIPATILSTPSGNPSYTLCSVAVPAQTFDWRPHCEGYCVFTGTGPDLQVDLMARLGTGSTAGTTGETAGAIVARGTQPAGQSPATHVLSAAPPPGSADSYDRVAAGTIAVLFLRAERQSGLSTFTTNAATTRFSVRVEPIP